MKNTDTFDPEEAAELKKRLKDMLGEAITIDDDPTTVSIRIEKCQHGYITRAILMGCLIDRPITSVS